MSGVEETSRTQQRAGFDRTLELARLDLAHSALQGMQRVAHRLGHRAAAVVQLALVGRVLRVERVGVGLVGMGGTVAQHGSHCHLPARRRSGWRTMVPAERRHRPQERENSHKTDVPLQHGASPLGPGS
jgi:hypothetical protein